MPRHLERFGADAILVTEPETTGDRLLAALAQTAGVIDVAAGACSLLLRFADWSAARAAIPALTTTAVTPGAAELGKLITIPVTYDGMDLQDVATECGLSPSEVIDLHQGAIYVVAFCGFSPGFAYLTGLPAELQVPRLSRPRPSVPAGAVAIADTWCGIYPAATPGGWRLIGHSDVQMFDVHRNPPALLTPGMRVRFATGQP